jgi:glyoxylase-like metal-dependent hydrolase (beta-lactamase superfamily II)
VSPPAETAAAEAARQEAAAEQRKADFAALDFPFGDKTPAPAETIEVAPGVHWLRMPLPAALDHINLWLLEDGDDWVIVDTGFANDETRALWRTLFKEQMGGRPAPRIIVTHFHPDHSGLAGWLCEQHDAQLWISRTEWLMHKMLMFDDAGRNSGFQAEFYRLNGLNAGDAYKMVKRGNAYQWVSVEAPHDFHRLTDGEEFDVGGRSWRVIVGTGHAPEHVSLFCEELRVLISGDQILPRITPNITLPGSQPTTNPLDDYLTSIDRFRQLPEDTLVLPSHILPFQSLHKRVEQLQRHHADRLGEILDAVDRPMTAAEVIPVMFGANRDFGLFERGFAMGEALAHLAYLEKQGRLRRSQDSDGLFRYAPAVS